MLKLKNFSNDGEPHKSLTMQQISRPGFADILLLLLISIIWGSVFSALKLVVFDLGTLWTAAFRVGIGFVALLPFFFFWQRELPHNGKEWLIVVIIACFSMVIPFSLISFGLKHVDAGVGSLLLGVTPFTAIILSHFFTTDEKINLTKFFAVLIGIGGIAVLVGPEAIAGVGTSTVAAQLSFIFAGVGYIIANLFMRRISLKPIPFTTIALGAGTIILVIVSYMLDGAPQGLYQLNTEGILAIIWVGLVPTGFAYYLRYYLVRRVGVSTFALAMNTVPIFGILIAAIWLGETIEWSTLLALALVLCGLMVARMGMPKREQPEPGE